MQLHLVRRLCVRIRSRLGLGLCLRLGITFDPRHLAVELFAVTTLFLLPQRSRALCGRLRRGFSSFGAAAFHLDEVRLDRDVPLHTQRGPVLEQRGLGLVEVATPTQRNKQKHRHGWVG